MAWLAGFTNRLKITIPSDNVDSTLTDFPILLKLSTDCGLTGFDASLVFDELASDANRFKIAVTASDGTTQRYVEIEKWDDSSEIAWLWVKVPSIAASGKTELYFYYDSTASDNTTYVGDIGDSAGQQVWTNDFWAVFHLGDVSGPFVDSTTTSGTDLNISGAPTLATPAKVAEGVDWGASQTASQGITGFTASNVTVESWVKQSTAATATRRYVTLSSEIAVIRQDTAGTGQFKWYIKTGGVVRAMTSNNQVDTDWAYWAGTWDGTTQRMYKDASEIGTPNVPGGTLNTGVGMSLNSGSENLLGLQDEVRVSTVARTESWLKTTYYTCNDNLLYMEEDVTQPEWLGTWDQRIKLTIDKDKVDENVINFPALVKVSDSSGITNTDLIAFFNELTLSSGTYNKSDYEDDFTGTNGDPPNTDKWTETDSSNSMDIQSNKLHFDGEGSGNKISYVNATFTFDGNSAFDIQVDFDLLTYTSPSAADNYVRLGISTGPVYTWMARQQGTGGATNRMRLVGNGGTNDFAWNWTGTTGKFRFTWDGTSVLKAYVWTGSQWEWNGNTSGYTCSEDYSGTEVRVNLLFEQETNGGDVEATFDNFAINSGHVIYDLNRMKVAFTTENGTQQCYAEIEEFDVTDERVLYWVKVPVISSSEDTILYLYYDSSQPDNTTYIGDIGDFAATVVWDDDFEIVCHMANSPTGSANDIKNSAKGWHGTTYNMGAGNLGTSSLGRYITFDGSAEFIDFGDVFYTNEVTMETIANVTSFTGGQPRLMIVKRNTVGTANTLDAEWSFHFTDATNLAIAGWNFPVNCGLGGAPSFQGTEYYVAATTGPSVGDAIKLYINDTTHGSCVRGSGDILNTASAWQIGARSNNNSSRYFYGSIREVRISTIVRPAEWTKATYYTSWDNFISYGSVETEPAPSVGTFNGYVELAGDSVARIVALYRRSTGELQDYTTSNPNTGYFELETPYDELHYLVILPDISDGYQPITRDQIDPV